MALLACSKTYKSEGGQQGRTLAVICDSVCLSVRRFVARQYRFFADDVSQLTLHCCSMPVVTHALQTVTQPCFRSIPKSVSSNGLPAAPDALLPLARLSMRTVGPDIRLTHIQLTTFPALLRLRVWVRQAKLVNTIQYNTIQYSQGVCVCYFDLDQVWREREREQQRGKASQPAFARPHCKQKPLLAPRHSFAQKR